MPRPGQLSSKYVIKIMNLKKMTVLGEKIPWHFQGSKVSPDGQKMPSQSQISQQYQSPEQSAFVTDTNFHKPLILHPKLHAPQINKTMSNLL